MSDIYYKDILLNDVKIKEMAQSGVIDENFPYLRKVEIMIPAIMANPSLINICGRNVLFNLNVIFEDEDIPLSVRQECLYYAIDRLETLPYSVQNLLDDEKFLRRICDKSIYAYIKVLNCIGNTHYGLMKDIFKLKYESDYIYNPDYPISFALSSPICFLNTIKCNSYYVHFFDITAYDDKVIDYIIDNKLFAESGSKMYQIPRITIAKLKSDKDFLYTLNAYCITGEVINYLKSINFKIDYTKFKNISLLEPDFLLFLLEDDIHNIKYIDDYRSIDYRVIDFLVANHYAYNDGDYEGLLTFDKIIKSTVLNGNLDYIVMHDVSLNDEMCNFVVDYIQDNNYDIKTIRNKTLMKNETFQNFVRNKYGDNNLFNLDFAYQYSNVARNLSKEFINCFSYETAMVIVEQIVLNNYYLDLDKIFQNMPINKFHDLYQKLVMRDCKFEDHLIFIIL